MKKYKKKSKKAKQKANTSSIATRERHDAKQANITIVGVGGGGGNIVNNLVSFTTQPVQTVILNTDEQSLRSSKADTTILLGEKRAKGLGTDGDPALGYESAIESEQAIRNALASSDLVFIVTGLGGGVGTGASIVVAEVAKSLGAHVVVIATTPFTWEGTSRFALAEKGIAELTKVADNVVVLHNNDLKTYLESIHERLGLSEAFLGMDRVIGNNIDAISHLILTDGLINLDYVGLQRILQLGKTTSVAFGEASGENRAKVATENALKNPFLSLDIKEAKGIILSVTGGNDFTFEDLDEVAEIIHGVLPPAEKRYHHANPFVEKTSTVDACIVIGAVIKDTPDMLGKVHVTIMLVK